MKSIRFDIKKTFTSLSDRVKATDIHSHEPWILVALYNGQINIHNYETQNIIKSFETSQSPVRSAIFVCRKNWIVCGSDDLYIRVFNYNTLEKVHSFEAHVDYIRHICVHTTKSLLISCGDDMLIKVWDWDKRFDCIQVLEGHVHYVMQIAINPKDNNQIASVSLDRKIKIWQIGTYNSTPSYTLSGHEKGVNGVDFCHNIDKPYLISCADDWNIKVWDYQNKSCIHTLCGHTNNVIRCIFHPNLPLIFSTSEDGTVRIWNISTYRCESTLNYGMGRVWCISAKKDSNDIVLGYDDGCTLIRVGKETPICCMDNSSGKIFTCKQNNILQANIKPIQQDLRDDDKILLSFKELGNCELYPQTISTSPNGRYLSILGDGEFVIYTTIALRSKIFGNGDRFAWCDDSITFAIRDGSYLILYKNFKIFKKITLSFILEEIYGGPLLCVRSNTDTYFYDWNELNLLIKIDIITTNIYWNNDSTLCILSDSTLLHLIKYNQPSSDILTNIPELGLPDSFEALYCLNESIISGIFIMDCFIFTTKVNRLCYLICNQIFTIRHLDRPYHVLGFMANINRLFLVDKESNIISYKIDINLIHYEIAILNKDFILADKIFPSIPSSSLYQLGVFLENQDLPQLALQVTSDIDHKFELSLKIRKLDTAFEIAKTIDNENGWRTLAKTALSSYRYDIAYECYKHIKDCSALFLLAICLNNNDILEETLEYAKENYNNNQPLIFMIYYITGRIKEAIDLLQQFNMSSEANLMAYSYDSTMLSNTFNHWYKYITESFNKYSQIIADPFKYPNLFPDLSIDS